MPFLSKNNPPSTSLPGVTRPKSEPKKRGRESGLSPTETQSSSDVVDQNHSKMVKVQASVDVEDQAPLGVINLNEGQKIHEEIDNFVDDNEEDQLPDPDELLNEVDLKEWKLVQIELIKVKFESKLADRNSTQANRMKHNVIRSYLDEMDAVLQMTEVPKEMALDDYIIELDPPTDNTEYNNADANVEQQLKKRQDCTVPLHCPFVECTVKFSSLISAKRHIIPVHFKMKLFHCTCGLMCSKLVNLQRHIRIQHLNMKYECGVCRGKYASASSVVFHAQLGHVMPENENVFSSPAMRQIEMRLFRPIDVTVAGGYTYQIYAIPWVNENGTLVDLSIDLTRFGNVQEIAQRLDAQIIRACETGTISERDEWVVSCGSARRERGKGHRMRSDLAFSLGLFGVSLVVAFQLKSFVRLYFDAVKIMATEESKYFLQDFNDQIKAKLSTFMNHPAMPEKIRNHVQLTGESFNLVNSQ